MLEQDFYDQLELSVPGKEYLALVDLCKDRALVPERGFEIHHIFPTSLGGLNVRANKVKFTVFEHCKAHALLAKAVPCYKTLQVVFRMSSGQVKQLSDLEKVTLEECFEWSMLREKAIHHPRSEEHRLKNSLGHKGKKLSQEHIRKRTARRLGTVTVTNGEITKYVSPSEVSEYERLGWIRGISEDRRKRMQESHRGLISSCLGRKCIHKGDEERKVAVVNLQDYLDRGWLLGRKESFVKKHSEAMVGKTNVGKVRVNKDGTGKLVSKLELQSYLDNGWSLGIAKKLSN